MPPAALMGRTTTASPSILASASGDMSRSCIHKFFLLLQSPNYFFVPEGGSSLTCCLRCSSVKPLFQQSHPARSSQGVATTVVNNLVRLSAWSQLGAEGQHGSVAAGYPFMLPVAPPEAQVQSRWGFAQRYGDGYTLPGSHASGFDLMLRPEPPARTSWRPTRIPRSGFR